MTTSLYQQDLLRHASDAGTAGHLDQPAASATINNPLCGDKISVDLALDDAGHVTAYAHETTACVLCQASAAMIGHVIEGKTESDMQAGQAALVDVLEERAETTPPPFEAFKIFSSVAAHQSRHQCVLLPFEAVLEAFKNKDAA